MTLAIANRGDPIQFRENTLPAIRAAANAGADMVRIDLTLSSDGYVVLLHDDTARRLWGRNAGAAGMSLADIAALGCGDDQRVPTLVEVLAEFGPLRALRFMLEVPSIETALATDDLVQELGLAEKTVYTGPVEVLGALRSHRPTAELALTWDRPELPSADDWQTMRPRLVNVHHALITRDMVTDAHGHGYQLSAWTVNDFTEMARLIGMGIDAIVTEHPAELAALAQGQRGDTAARGDGTTADHHGQATL